MHNGFGCTAKLLKTWYDSKYKEMNIKVIGITLPGWGYSTPHPNRNISDWHKDVEHILRKENIYKFGVYGDSFGG